LFHHQEVGQGVSFDEARQIGDHQEHTPHMQKWCKKDENCVRSQSQLQNRRCLSKKLLMHHEMIIKEGTTYKITPRGDELLSNLKEVSASLDLR
jgi:hypothetical protein